MNSHAALASLCFNSGDYGRASMHLNKVAELGGRPDPQLLRLLEPHRKQTP
jgi:hypothetical protein